MSSNSPRSGFLSAAPPDGRLLRIDLGGRVLGVMLDRPGSRNAITLGQQGDLDALLSAAAADDNVPGRRVDCGG